MTIAPVTNDAGRVLFVAPTGTDITDRKRAEESVQFLSDASASLAELVDHESTLGRIANSAVGGFADWCVMDVLDDAGDRRRLAVANTESATVIGAPAGQPVTGRDASEGTPHVLRTGEPEVVPDLAALDPATAAQRAERIERLRAWGVRSPVVAGPGNRRDDVPECDVALPLRCRGTAAAQELARRVTAAIDNAGLYRTLQEQDRRKDEFLATLAHELRNPLAPVRNGVQILRVALPNNERGARWT